METRHIGRIVTGCLVGGLVVALALVLGPVEGGQEPVIAGTVLLTFAASWALLATLSMRTGHQQRWAFAVARFIAMAGVALLVFAPSDVVMEALGWVWPPPGRDAIARCVETHRNRQERPQANIVGVQE